MIAEQQELPPRGEWLVALRAAGDHEVRALAGDLRARHPVRYRRAPEQGLGMLQLREPNLGQRFLLGELPLATAEVAIGEQVGAASVLHDDPELATDLAICDAVLAGRLEGHAAVAGLIAVGRAALARERRVRAGLLHRTTVDFSRLEEAEDDD